MAATMGENELRNFSKLEYLAFPDISKHDIELFNVFIEKIEVIGLAWNNNKSQQQILTIRKDKKLKLPDAIFAGCSLYKKLYSYYSR